MFSHTCLINGIDWEDCEFPKIKYASLYEQSALSMMRILNLDPLFPCESLNDGALQHRVVRQNYFIFHGGTSAYDKTCIVLLESYKHPSIKQPSAISCENN